MLSACGRNSNDAVKTEVDSLAVTNPAISDLTARIAGDRDNPGLYHLRAMEHLSSGDHTAALSDLGKAMDLAPAHPGYPRLMGRIYLEKKDPRNAALYLARSAELDPHSPETALLLAKTQLYLPDPGHVKMLQHLDRVLSADRRHPEAWFLKGMALKENGDTSGALSAFAASLESEPAYYDACMQLGLLHLARHNDLALDYFDRAIGIDSNAMEAYYAKGMHFQNAGRYNMALDVYKAMIGRDPQNEQAFYNIGYIYYEHLDSLDNAYKYFNFAVRVAPQYAKAYYMRGLCLEEKGDLAAALRDYRQALNLDRSLELAEQRLRDLKASD